MEIAYYMGKELSLGFRFANAVEEAAARAATFPDSGSPATKDTRHVFLKGFPFSVVYRSDKSGILIFALAHHSRQPEYWHSRIQDR